MVAITHAAAISATIMGLAGPALTQGRNMTVLPRESGQGAALDVFIASLDHPARAEADATDRTDGMFRIGERVVMCVTSAREGHVSLWNMGETGPLDRVHPNEHVSVEDPNGDRVAAGEELCVGRGRVRLTIGEPAGISKVYVHWSAGPEGQFREDDLVTIGDSKSVARGFPDFDSQTLEYRVVE